MNGIENILQSIRSEAKTEIDAILQKAREEAAEIEERYRKQAEAEAAALEQKRFRAAQEQEERLLSVAQMEARKVLLASKQELVDRAYELALEQLCAMPEKEKAQILAELLAQTPGCGEVIVSPEDHDSVGKAAVKAANASTGKQLVLSEETRPMRGGFILRSGSIEINGTFETLLRLQKAETAGMVAKKLFG